MRANGLADVLTKPRGGLASGREEEGRGRGKEGRGVSREGHETCSTTRGPEPVSHRVVLDANKKTRSPKLMAHLLHRQIAA